MADAERLSRRKLLALTGTIATAGALAACATTAPTNMTETPKPASSSVPIEVTVRAESLEAMTEKDLRLRAEIEWNKYHHQYPSTEGAIKLPEPKQFMKVPIRAVDIPKVWVSQAWEVNSSETKISAAVGHQAIDISGPYGTLVVAPCSGWIMFSLQEGWRSVAPTIDGKQIGYAGGIFGQICTPWDEMVQAQHLAGIHEGFKNKLKFSKPTPDGKGGWDPINTNLRSEQLKSSEFATWVETGEPIGYMGYSGLGIGSLGKYKGEDWPILIEESDYKTWDPVGPHVHLEVFFRNERGSKYGRRDPFGIYSIAKLYSLDGTKPLGKEPMFLTDAQGLPLAA